MNKIFLGLLCLLLFLFFTTDSRAASNTILINEVLYDPAGTDLGHEWIEFYSISDTAVDLSGWQIQIAGSTFNTIFTIPNGTTIPSNSFLTVGEISTTANIKVSALAMQNGGSSTDGVRLLNNSLEIVDTVLYDDDNTANLPDDTGLAGTKFALDVTSGYSLCRRTSTDTDDSSIDFITCTQITPGTANILPDLPEAKIIAPTRVFLNQEVQVFGAESSSPNGDVVEWTWKLADKIYIEPNPLIKFTAEGNSTLSLTIKDEIGMTDDQTSNITVEKFVLSNYKGLVISEVFPSPDTFDANQDKTADTNDEFIEITNTTTNDINLSGLQLADESTIEEPQFTFTEVILKPKEVLVLFKDSSKITLNNDSDTIYLLGPNGETISKLSYTTAKDDQSVNQFGTYTFTSTQVTPGLYVSPDQLATTGYSHPFLKVFREVLSFYIRKKYAMLGVSNLVYTKVKWLQENQKRRLPDPQDHQQVKLQEKLNQQQKLRQIHYPQA